MPARFPVPDEARLERLIAEALEQSPGPDLARIDRIGAQLARRRPLRDGPIGVNKIPWWIVLLLAGGMATAAWWAGERLFSPPSRVDGNSPHEMKRPAEEVPPQPHREGGQDEGEDGNEEKDPLIYQREINYQREGAQFKRSRSL